VARKLFDDMNIFKIAKTIIAAPIKIACDVVEDTAEALEEIADEIKK